MLNYHEQTTAYIEWGSTKIQIQILLIKLAEAILPM